MRFAHYIRAMKILVMWLLLTLGAGLAQADSGGAFVYSPENDGAFIGPAASTFTEPKGELSPAQIVALWDDFSPNNGSYISLSAPEKGHWIRWAMSSTRPGATPIIEIATSGFKTIDLYRLDGQSLVHLGRSGRRVPFDERLIPDTHHAFKVELTSVPTTYLFRIATSQKVTAPIQVKSFESYQHDLLVRVIVKAAFYGFIMLMVAYQLAVYFFSRERLLLSYVGVAMGYVAMQAELDGTGYALLYGESLLGSLTLRAFGLTIASVSWISFIRVYLNGARRWPRLFQLQQILAAVTIAGGFLGYVVPLPWANLVSLPAASLMMTMSYIGAIQDAWRGHRASQLFVSSWTPFLGAALLEIGSLLGGLEFGIDTSVAMMVGAALQLAIMAVAMSERMNWLREDLEAQRVRLEEQVDERRVELAKAQANLTKSQKQLAQSERMAALGDMVAGIAHEINTPIGIGITASSRMDEVIRDLENHLENNTLKKSSLVGGLKTLREAEDIILNNLQRAAELIMSFKQVSADQASGTMRTFDLSAYTRDILRGLETKVKRSNVDVQQVIPDDIRIFGPAGAYAQLLTNLVQNSLLHGFHNRASGTIVVSASMQEGMITWVYEDDGNGISKEAQERVFEPFYTTARERGGTGLGLSIIMNLVTGSFGGTMELSSEKNKGVRFEVQFPAQLSASEDAMQTAVLTGDL